MNILPGIVALENQSFPFVSCFCSWLLAVQNSGKVQDLDVLKKKHAKFYRLYMLISGCGVAAQWNRENPTRDLYYASGGNALEWCMQYASMGYKKIVNNGDNRQAFIDAIKSSIETGHPVMARCLIGETWSLITGYDHEGDTLIGYHERGSDFKRNLPDEYLENGMFVKDDWYCGIESIVLFDGKIKHALSADEVISHLISVLERTEPDDSQWGFPAFTQWFSFFDDSAFFERASREELLVAYKAIFFFCAPFAESRAFSGNTFNTMEFINKIKADWFVKEKLKAVSVCFRASHSLVWKIWAVLGENFCYEPEKYVERLRDPEVRRQAVELVKELENSDRQALSYMKECLGHPQAQEEARAEPDKPIQKLHPVKRHVIEGIKSVKHNEFVTSIQALCDYLGQPLDYQDLVAETGSAFRMSVRKGALDPGGFHTLYNSAIVDHSFSILGLPVQTYSISDLRTDSKRIFCSLDHDLPVLTLCGPINCSGTNILTGYDEFGQVMLGYSAHMDIRGDHNEIHDKTNYYRKTDWYEAMKAPWHKELGDRNRYFVLQSKSIALMEEDAMALKVLDIAKDLIIGNEDEYLATGKFAYAYLIEFLKQPPSQDPFEVYMVFHFLNKIYDDKHFAAAYCQKLTARFPQHHNLLSKAAKNYRKVNGLLDELQQQVLICDWSQSRIHALQEQEVRQKYAQILTDICAYELECAEIFDQICRS